jgi:hypothetical protein
MIVCRELLVLTRQRHEINFGSEFLIMESEL